MDPDWTVAWSIQLAIDGREVVRVYQAPALAGTDAGPDAPKDLTLLVHGQKAERFLFFRVDIFP